MAQLVVAYITVETSGDISQIETVDRVNIVTIGNTGTSGYSGASGASGTGGGSGTSGFSGYSGKSGFSGASGASGVSGFSGANPGTSGFSGASGASGKSGFSGVSGAGGGGGTSGASGASGFSGVSGFSGLGTIVANHGSDDTYTGIILTGLNAGATIAQWEAVYLGGSSTWLLADANGSGTYPARGLATAAYSNTNPAIILTYGTVRNDAWSWTIGGLIYLSGTPGGLTQTAPASSGDQVQVVGYALTSDIAFFDMNGTYLTVT